MPRRRRVRTDPVPGSDPTPTAGERAAEDEPASWGDADGPNDARLRADKPPHWG